jgi:hypothetical protein
VTAWVDKINALIAKAEASEFPEERDAFLVKADELMVKYAIEEYELDAARVASGLSSQLKPIIRDIEIPYMALDTASDLYNLWYTITEAIGVKILFDRFTGNGSSGYRYAFKVVGYDTDIRYAELLFTTLHLQMVKAIQPEVDLNHSFDANVFALHEAGIKWVEIARQLNKTGAWDVVKTDWSDAGSRVIADGGKLKRAYRRECERRGIASHAIPQSKAYRNSFVGGFLYGLRIRLTTAREETALVSVDRKSKVEDLFNSILPPVVVVEDDGKKRKAVRASRVRVPRFDEVAWSRGREVARKADLGRDSKMAGQAAPEVGA